MDSATREIIDLHVLQNKQDLLSKTKSVADMAKELGIKPDLVYTSIDRLRRKQLYPPAKHQRPNRKKKQLELPIIDLTPPEAEPSETKSKDDVFMEMKATIMAQEQIIKYLEKQLGMRHGSSV